MIRIPVAAVEKRARRCARGGGKRGFGPAWPRHWDECVRGGDVGCAAASLGVSVVVSAACHTEQGREQRGPERCSAWAPCVAGGRWTQVCEVRGRVIHLGNLTSRAQRPLHNRTARRRGCNIAWLTRRVASAKANGAGPAGARGAKTLTPTHQARSAYTGCVPPGEVVRLPPSLRVQRVECDAIAPRRTGSLTVRRCMQPAKRAGRCGNVGSSAGDLPADDCERSTTSLIQKPANSG